MSTVKKTEQKNYYNVVVSNDVKSHASDPYFVKKAEKAKAFLEKNPIPTQLLKKN